MPKPTRRFVFSLILLGCLALCETALRFYFEDAEPIAI